MHGGAGRGLQTKCRGLVLGGENGFPNLWDNQVCGLLINTTAKATHYFFHKKGFREKEGGVDGVRD